MKRLVSTLSSTLIAILLPSMAGAQYYYVPVSSGITRAEFVKLAMERTNMYRTDGTHCFTDVTNQDFAPYICAAKQSRIITGDPVGTFRPYDPIAFVEAAAIIVRAERVATSGDSIWYRPYLEKMSDWDAIPSSIRNILDPISYAQATEMISRAMGDSHDDDDDDRNQDDDNDDDDVDIRIEVSDSTPEPGERITFRIRLDNEDNDDIEDLEVVAELDKDMDFVSASDGGDEDDDEVEWDDIEIDEDNTTTLLLTVEIDDRADDGDTLRLRVEADDSSATRTVRVDDDDDDNDDGNIEIRITDDPDPVDEDDIIEYSIRIENTDNEDIYADITAFLDDDTDFVSASDGGDESRNEVDWDRIRIDEDETETLTLRVRVKSSVRDGDTLRLRVRANGEEDTETTRVDLDEDDDDDDDERVRITISDDPDPAEIGDRVTYRITIENEENHDIEIDVRAFLDEGMSYLFSSHEGELDRDDEVLWEDFEIDEDESRVLSLTVRINSEADDGDILRLKVEAGDDEDTESTEIED